MMLAPGEIVGPFAVESLLGRGAAATVWAVRRRDGGGVYALKVLSTALPTGAARLRLEAQELLSMRHPNVVSVTDVVEVNGHLALVMERVHGPSLDRLLAREVLDWLMIDRLFAQVLDGVEAAHARALVHRDLKPSNVLVAESGGLRVAKVSDFGLVKALHAALGPLSLTQPFEALGTPGYVAPEQMIDATSVDQRADIFSLGCILYRMAAGRTAFPGDLRGAVVASLRGEYKPLEQAAPGAPATYAAAVRACLSPGRDQRPPTVAALRAMLSLPGGAPAVASPPPSAEPETLGLGDIAAALGGDDEL
ncbi:MAG: serine/threonine protein kinase [Deltaproteobacteria bacterium]|nr:serine/threonine protein kinase [Deltaproteobacteria bacterium]